MKRISGRPTTAAVLIALAYELLDAHTDTVELALAEAGGLRWAAHLEYLRALHRTAERILAQASEAETAGGAA